MNLDPFVEVEIVEQPRPRKPVINWIEREPAPEKPRLSLWRERPAEPVVEEQPVPEPAEPIEFDPIRARFVEMRRLAQDWEFKQNRAFYSQARFMVDFTDDYDQVAPMEGYHPVYQKMNYEQLRTYFTWRTQVRQGNIQPTSVAYAFVYLYELLCQIGVDSPQDGLDKILSFWHSYQAFDATLDPYMIEWLKDYHIYFSAALKQSFTDFAQEQGLQVHYPEVFVYEIDESNFWSLYTNISNYNIEGSMYYTPDKAPMIQACFYFLLTRLQEVIEASGKRFEDLIFHSSKDMHWRPFNRAVFYQKKLCIASPVILSPRESYHVVQESLRRSSTFISSSGEYFIGYLLKEMESNLRDLTGGRVITAKTYKVHHLLRKLSEIGIEFPDFVQLAVRAFYHKWTHQPVKVELNNLGKVREEALEIQEKLIVPEDEPVSVVAVKQVVTAETPSPAVVTPLDEPSTAGAPTSPWEQLKEALTPVEREALSLVLAGQPIEAFAREKFIMLEVLVDGINEKAMDHVGDALLELDETVTLYEEYTDDVRKMVNN